MFNLKIVFWFVILLLVPVSMSFFLIHERNETNKELHLINLSFKNAPVLAVNENTFKNDLGDNEKFQLVDKVNTYKKNADDAFEEIKEKSDGSTNEELSLFKESYSSYDMFMNNVYKQMQVGNFIDIVQLNNISKIYNMDMKKVDSLIPMDYSTIGWFVLIYYICVLLLILLYYHPEGFLDIFLDIILLGFIFKN